MQCDGKELRVLLFGSGEIGTAVARELSKQGHTFHVVSRSPNRNLDLLPGPSNFTACELGIQLLPENLLDNITTIIYTAGIPNPALPWNTLPIVVHQELHPLQSLCTELDARGWSGRLIFTSSGGTVYGSANKGKWKETSACHPVSPYGVAKLAAECLLDMYGTHSGTEICVTRISNVIGTKRNSSHGIGFVQTAVENTLKGKPLVLFGDGQIIRDFVDVFDAAKCLVDIALLNAPLPSIVNISSGMGLSLQTVVQEIATVLNVEALIDHQPRRPLDIQYNVLDNTLLRSLVNLELMSLSESVRRIIGEIETEF